MTRITHLNPRRQHWRQLLQPYCHSPVSALGTQAADIVVGQVAPLSGVLASTGKDMVLGAKSASTTSTPRAGSMAISSNTSCLMMAGLMKPCVDGRMIENTKLLP